MPSQSNKRLPPSPADTAALSHHHVVSPMEIRDQPTTTRPELPNHHSSDTLHTDSDKASTLLSETASATAKWQSPPISKTKSESHWWPWEWLCELLAVGSLGAMCFALWYYQDRPQADWQQSYFTLNGLVAFLATLTKTGLIIPVSAAIGQWKWLRLCLTKGAMSSLAGLATLRLSTKPRVCARHQSIVRGEGALGRAGQER